MVNKRFLAFSLTLAILLSQFSMLAYAAESKGSIPSTDTEASPPNDTDGDVPDYVPGLVPEDTDFEYVIRPLPPSSSPGSPELDRFDSRSGEYACQSPAKNQGPNGLCWAFGTYAIMEAYMKKNDMGEFDFSELHMAYATSNKNKNGSSNGNDQGYDRFVNAGGNRLYAAAYLMRGSNLSGAVFEEDDPYTADNYDFTKEVLPDRKLSVSQLKEKTYQVQNILFLTGNYKPEYYVEIFDIKQHILLNGGVAASMYSDQTTANNSPSNQKYYNKTTHAYYYDGKKHTNRKDHPT